MTNRRRKLCGPGHRVLKLCSIARIPLIPAGVKIVSTAMWLVVSTTMRIGVSAAMRIGVPAS